ncbi:MAG TPA: hypothetical protein VFG43_03065 [Geminicoccaceae bacterium]|nr:hypothetical protein [Geminicoccaceae bacterium]
MGFVWFLLGLVVGAAAVWFWLDRKSGERLAEVEAGWDRRLRHAADEVKQADLAHEETKQRLITSEMALRGHEDRTAQLEAELAQATQAAEQARLLEARSAAARAEARDAAARFETEAGRAKDEAERSRGENERLKGEIARLQQELAAGTRRLQAPEARGEATPAAPPSAAVPAGRAEVVRPTTPEAARVPPPATRAGMDGPRQRLKAIDARLAMLPAGSSARDALLAEKARLQADAQGGSGPSAPAS